MGFSCKYTAEKASMEPTCKYDAGYKYSSSSVSVSVGSSYKHPIWSTDKYSIWNWPAYWPDRTTYEPTVWQQSIWT
jgi:hypothetical protein